MVFSVKATYNGETRRWINVDDVFPTYQALADQIHKVFKTVDRFYISDVLFSTGSDNWSPASNRVRNAQEWADADVAGSHLGKSYANGSLRFVVQDMLEHRVPSGGRTSWGYDMEVDADTTPAQQGGEATTPQSNRSSIVTTGSNGSCCSLASTKTEVKGMVDNFLKEFQKTMSDTFGDDAHMAETTPALSAPSHERTPVQSARPLSPERLVPGAFDVPTNPDDEAIHRGVMCDHCHKIVKGIRFKCKVCFDFDLCQECMGENSHGGVVHSAQYDVEHSFRSIIAPQRRRRLHEAIAASRARASQATSGNNNKPVHNAYCDVCGKTIVGSRHKCLDCIDYDMCDECITNKRSEHHSHHQFLELKEPGRVVVHTVADAIPPTNLHAINPPNFSQASNEDHQGPHHRRGLDHEHRHQFRRFPPAPGYGWRPHMGESPDELPHHHGRHHGRHGHHPGMVPFFPPPPMPGVFPMVPPPPPPPLVPRFPPPPPPPPPPPVVLPTRITPLTPAARAPATPNPVAHNANCDMCDSKIFGVRHKCLTCPDYDVCASCFAIVPEQHPKHPFVKVNHPKDLLVKPVHIVNRTIHSASCDACHKKIIGVRYKCLHPTCPDYDLCENCEALPIDAHPSSHAMVKMKQPLYSYEGLQKIFNPVRDVKPAVVVVTPKASPKVSPITEMKPIVDIGESSKAAVMSQSLTVGPVILSMPPPMVPVPVPVPAPITINRQWFERFAAANEIETPILYQGEGEKAKPVVLSSRASSVSSSVSGELVEKTESLHLEDDKPVTVQRQISETESPFTDDNAVRSVTPSSLSVISVTSAPVEAPLRASFVADNTIPDGFVIPAGTVFVKSWKVVNNGETSWPSSVRLVFAGGERLGTEKNTSIPVLGEVKPGDEYDISISFSAPPTIGHFISYWCMEDGEGQTFGHRLWCDIEVVEPVEKSSNTPLSSSTVIMPAPASIAATSPVTATPLSPTEFATPALIPTPTISSAPSEVDLEDDNESDVSGLWEDATRAPSPDEFVMVYDSVSDGDSDI